MPSPRFHPALRLIFCVLGALFLSFLVYLVIRAGLAATTPLTGRAVSFDTFAERNPLPATLLFYPSVLLWIWFCRSAFDRRSVGSLGLRGAGAGRGFLAGALGGTLAISLLFGVLWLTGHVAVSGPSPEAVRAGTPATVAILVFFALAFFAVGLTEEIVFRGYALHNLAAWVGVTAAVSVQATVFALIHLGNVATQPTSEASSFVTKLSTNGAPLTTATADLGNVLWDTRWAMLNIVLIGVFFALCYLKTGSLWFSIGFHTAWNFCLGCVFSLPVSGIKVFRALEVAVSPNALVTGGSFGAEGSVLLSALIAVMIWIVWQQPSHAHATLALASLRGASNDTQISDTSLALPAETPASADADAETEYAPPRFQTTMRPAARTTPLDRSALEALQALNRRIPLPDIAAVNSQNASGTSEATLLAATPLQSVAATDEAHGEAARAIVPSIQPSPAFAPLAVEASPHEDVSPDSAPTFGVAGATENLVSAPTASEPTSPPPSTVAPPPSTVAPPPSTVAPPDSTSSELASREPAAAKPAAAKPAAKKPAPKW